MEVQKEKLKKELNQIIEKHEQKFNIGEVNDFVKLSIYDIEEINYLERTIEKTKLVSRFKEALAH